LILPFYFIDFPTYLYQLLESICWENKISQKSENFDGLLLGRSAVTGWSMATSPPGHTGKVTLSKWNEGI